MFCTKCGAEAVEGAVFCTRCGAKLRSVTPSNAEEAKVTDTHTANANVIDTHATEANVTDTHTANANVIDTNTASANATDTTSKMQDVCKFLSENASECPQIKKIRLKKVGFGKRTVSVISINGLLERHYIPNLHIQKLEEGWHWPFILFILFPFMICDGVFLNLFFEGEYYLPLTMCCLIECIIWFFIIYLVHRERCAVRKYVNKYLNFELESPSKVFLFISGILNAVEIVLCVIALIFTLQSNAYSRDNDYDYSDRKTEWQQTEGGEKQDAEEQAEYADLTETYVNQEEGFSFMYPHDWEIDSVEETDSDVFVSVSRTGGLGVYASIAVSKDIDDGSFFAVTKTDFEETYAYVEGISDVEIMDLSDTVLDGYPTRRLKCAFVNENGVRVTSIQYFYIRDSYVYAVTCVVQEALYDRYESIFDAVMNTYTIAEAQAMEEMVPYDVYDKEAALQYMIDWFERFPLSHNIRIRFMEEAVDDGIGSSKYLKYELDMAEGYDTAYEWYGIFYVNPDDGSMIMESITDDRGRLMSIQAPMDEWYLEYYWGWTDDSGYYSEFYGNDLYGIYDDMNTPILEYHADNDSYVICNFDIVCFMEYHDNPTASGIGIDDFAGSYYCDLSFELEGHYVENGYILDIGNVEYNSFSIEESWRGNDLLRDDYAQPRMLIEDTLYFAIYNPESAGYEMHYLTYIPAKDSPLGKDVVYLDSDDTMPFEKE